ncbi:hypothetical protein WJR50_16640 [Catalinimonas sp. 4WD22]|uniref:hypothetical protein n=1 Tax=Catalinimonas locisalis TaxID=3133978 RepID=UPI0031018E98
MRNRLRNINERFISLLSPPREDITFSSPGGRRREMYLLCLLLFIGSLHCANAQEFEEEKETANYHRLTLVLGHANVLEGIKDGKKEWLVLGSWGLDYDYWFHPQWAVGLHSDLIVENFEVEQMGEGETVGTLERSSPLASTLVGIFKPGEHFTILLGAGGEFAREETLFLIRAGLEYGWELPGEWELGVSLMQDIKVDAYNSWTLGVGVSKIFGKALEE